MPVLLRLRTTQWELEISGALVNIPPFVPTGVARFKLEGEAELYAYAREENGLKRIVDPDSATCEPLFFENASYDFYLFSNTANADLELPAAATKKYAKSGYTHQAINYANDVGYSEIGVTGANPVRLRFEVFPTKVDYRSDYVAMRDEVSAIARNLAMTVQARTFGMAAPDGSADQTLNEWVSLLRHYFDSFAAAGRQIAATPHSVLRRSSQWVELHKSRRVDVRRLGRQLRSVYKISEYRAEVGVVLPQRVPDIQRRTTYDTPENRYVKFLLAETARNLRAVLRARASGDEDAEISAEEQFFDALRPAAKPMLAQVHRLLNAPFLEDVPAALPTSAITPVFSKHPAYASFAKYARLLNGGLSFAGEALSIGIKNIALLYEYWCFLRLVKVLREDLDLDQQSLVRWRHTKLVITLAKGFEAAVRFRDRATGKALRLVYNRLFRDLPTVAQKPDNVLQIAEEDRLHVLDAKYRLSAEADYCERYGGVGPTVEDINTMHRYRDAIAIPHPTATGEYRRGVVKTASVLFPYPNEAAYRTHRFYRSLSAIQIGGVPFLPGVTNLVEDYVRQLLRSDGYAVK